MKIAYYAILDRKPDAVISGINLGSNTGINVIYSGTVSAATEGNVLGIPSFAISLATYTNPNFPLAAQFTKKLLPQLLENKLPKGTCLNVNVPNVASSLLMNYRKTLHFKQFILVDCFIQVHVV